MRSQNLFPSLKDEDGDDDHQQSTPPSRSFLVDLEEVDEDYPLQNFDSPQPTPASSEAALSAQPEQSSRQQAQPGPSGENPLLPPTLNNRTVTRDLRRAEFKEMAKKHDRTNYFLEQIVELKKMELRLKYPGNDFNL